MIIIIALIWKWKKIPSEKKIAIPLGLVIGGFIGNLIDRAFLGYVTDFIFLNHWPVFNVADSCITIGVFWLVIVLWKRK
jgi:signal peptidase II